MFRSVFFAILLVGCLVFAGWICACHQEEQTVITIAPELPPNGPVLAKVGESEVLLEEVTALAELARQLRSHQGFPAGPQEEEKNHAELAVELQALAVVADELLDTTIPSIRDEYERLLARVYLKRFVSRLEKLPIDDKELEKAYYDEIMNYMTLGQSEIYRATRVDATGIMVAYFPDQHVPETDEKPVLDRDAALALARKIHAACLGARKDLDTFMRIGRDFMSGNPSVVFEEFWRKVQNPELNLIDPVIHAAIINLENNGDISEPVETKKGFLVVRRGATHPGKGEQFEDVRELLEEKVSKSRREIAVKSHLEGLANRYQVRIWHDRLTEKNQPRSPVK